LTDNEPISTHVAVKEAETVESAEDDFLLSDNNKSPSPKKMNEIRYKKSVSPKKLVDDNIFDSKDTPNSIMSNIKEFIGTPEDHKMPKQVVTIQNTSFGLIQEKQPNKVTSTGQTFDRTVPAMPENQPQYPPYMMPYPMFFYPPGFDPSMQQQGQYPPMYYFMPPYGMPPQDNDKKQPQYNAPQYIPQQYNVPQYPPHVN
jgi:hypothetical protein